MGIFTNYQIEDKKVLWISLFSVFIISLPKILFYVGWVASENLWGYKFGYELLPLNGLITFSLLILLGRKQN